jgi:predicted dehydrogenase
MKIGVIGCGSIGKRHISNLLKFDDIEIYASDISKETLKSVKEEFNIEGFNKIEYLLEKINLDAVFICTPNILHLQHAHIALKKDCHIFMEKPISINLEGLKELKKLIRKKKKIFFTACNMRFHPGIKKIKELIPRVEKIYYVKTEFGHYLPYWRPSTDYRKSYSANKEQGGGIILDSIHEIDYISWLFGKPKEIFCIAEKLSDLEINVEDSADILLRTRKNITIQIHLDYLQKFKRRSCQVIGSNGTIIWTSEGKNPEKAEIKYYDDSEKEWGNYKIDVDTNKSYIDQTLHFLNCLKGLEEPISNIEFGITALKIALLAKESVEKRKTINF